MKDVIRLVLWLRSARGWTLAAVVLGLAAAATNTGLLGVATYLISAAALHPPLIALAGALAAVRLFGLSRGFVRYAERLVSHDVTFRLLARLRLWLFSRLVRLASGQLLALRSADLLGRLVRDVDEVQTVFQQLVAPLAIASVTFLVVSGALWMLAVRLEAVAVATLLALGLLLPVASVLSTRTLQARQVHRRAELDVRIADTLFGLPDLLACSQAGRHLEATYRLAGALEHAQQRLATMTGLRVAAQDVVVRFGAWTMLFVAIPLVTAHVLDATYLAVVPILLLGVAEVFEPLAQTAQRLAATRSAAARLLAIADCPPALSWPADPPPEPAATSLVFERVGFAYDGPLVLHDVNFTLRRGHAVGIIGPSGAGKSSVLQLAVRAWDPTSGQVRLDEHDLRDVSAETLTRTVGLLTHDSYIFSGTVRENLQLASPTATDAEMYAALSLVELADLAAERPDGLDTWLGEQGARLSGGERQRLAIARMLLLDTPFLLFDEPTANMDPATERTIMQAIRSASQTCGVLLVTHRLVDLDWLDELLVMDAGRIVERGRGPADLLRCGGLYARLAQVQDDVLSLA